MQRYTIEYPATVVFTVWAEDEAQARERGQQAAEQIGEDEVVGASGSAYVAVDTTATPDVAPDPDEQPEG